MLIALLVLFTGSLLGAASSKTSEDWEKDGNVLMDEGKYAAAVSSFSNALAAAEQSQPAKLYTLRNLHASLACAFVRAGKFTEAKAEFTRALALEKNISGDSSLEYAFLMADIAFLPAANSPLTDVVTTLRRAIAANGRSRVKDLPLAQDYLAKALYEQGKIDEAYGALEDFPKSAAAVRKSDPALAAQLFNDLALIREHQTHYDEAAEFESQAIALIVAYSGVEHPDLVIPLANLATISEELSRLADADALFSRSTVICFKTSGEDNQACGEILARHATLLRKMGRKKESKKMLAQARHILEESNRINGVGFTIAATDLASR